MFALFGPLWKVKVSVQMCKRYAREKQIKEQKLIILHHT